MLLIIRQQVQPAFIIEVMQAQQASIIALQDESPLVQVTQTPSSVGSHLHMAMVRLQQQTIIPFIMQQQLHSPPGIMLQRFWSIVAETLSSHEQVIFIPPAHFLNVIVQRGTITTFIPFGVVAGAPNMPLGFDTGILDIPRPARSIMIADVMPISFSSRVVLSSMAAHTGQQT
jgi:hypothetical protein